MRRTPGEKSRVLNVQFGDRRETGLVTVRTQILGPRQFHLAHGSEYGPGAQLAVVGLMAARAREVRWSGAGARELQQFIQGCCAGLMQGGAQGHLDRFQIRSPVFRARRRRGPAAVYFARDFGMDRFRRFFSSGVNVSSTGRSAQIFSLTSRPRRVSGIDETRLPPAAPYAAPPGNWKVSVVVLPATLRVRRKWGSWPGSLGLAQWQ